MEQSILKSVKKVLNIADDYTVFDADITMFTNTALGVLNQLGVGPAVSFTVEDNTQTWDDLQLPADQLALAKSDIFLRVRLLFDPPQVSFVLDAYQKEIEQLEWRLKEMREFALPPAPDPILDAEVVVW